MQIDQLANLVSQIQSAGSENLPSQTIPNPKRRKREHRDADKRQGITTDSRVQQRAKTTPLPFPSRSLFANKPETDEDLLKMFRRVEINIPLLDAIKHIPEYAKFLKELCIHKRKKLKARAK
ncbi:hypothetical protein CR513_18724, partial [Mucuna pruriens]